MNIPLHSKKYPGLFAVVDDGDYDLVSQYRWNPYWSKKAKTFYATASIKKNDKWVTMMMHRLILKPDNSESVDHRNHNGLINTRSNIRVVTHQQNMMNRQSQIGSSRYKGVSWYKVYKKWIAYIKINGKLKYLGYYYNETDAALAYNEKAKELFGEYAYPNNV